MEPQREIMDQGTAEQAPEQPQGLRPSEDGQSAVVFVPQLDTDITLETFKELQPPEQVFVYIAIFEAEPESDELSKNEKSAVEEALSAPPAWDPAGAAPEGMDTGGFF